MHRLSQPSTWAGLAAIAQVAKAFLPPQWQWVSDAVSAAGGSAAVALNERPRAQ